jgi:sialic acid synthase SpsE
MIDLSCFSPASRAVFIIAEIGVNHDGDLSRAVNLIYEATRAGCDAVKFQVWNSDHIYPVERVGAGEHARMKALELSHAELRRLDCVAADAGVIFFATPDEIEDAHFLASIGVRLIKVSSHDVTNLELLRGIRALGIPTILSTGAATANEVDEAFTELQPAALLHCVSSYPAPVEQMNLRTLEWYDEGREMCACLLDDSVIGLSDHTIGIAAACASLALGARIFEKHLTLDRNAPGPDHAASATPDEMAEYVRTLRALAIGMGDGVKRVMPCEAAARAKWKPWLAT